MSRLSSQTQLGFGQHYRQEWDFCLCGLWKRDAAGGDLIHNRPHRKFLKVFMRLGIQKEEGGGACFAYSRKGQIDALCRGRKMLGAKAAKVFFR